MADDEKSQGLSSGMWMGIGILGVFLAGGCLLACLGLVGLGFALPAAKQAQQAARAQAEAHEAQRQAAQQAAQENARTSESPAEKADEVPLNQGTSEPQHDATPAKAGDRHHDE
jgi:hypothetical protein